MFNRPHKRPMPVIARLLIGGCLCAFIDPLLDQRDLSRVERRTLVWHLRDLGVRAFDGLNQEAVTRFAGPDSSAALAASERGGGAIEFQPALLRRRTVALHAGGLEQRLDLPRIIDGRGRQGACRQREPES